MARITTQAHYRYNVQRLYGKLYDLDSLLSSVNYFADNDPDFTVMAEQLDSLITEGAKGLTYLIKLEYGIYSTSNSEIIVGDILIREGFSFLEASIDRVHSIYNQYVNSEDSLRDHKLVLQSSLNYYCEKLPKAIQLFQLSGVE